MSSADKIDLLKSFLLDFYEKQLNARSSSVSSLELRNEAEFARIAEVRPEVISRILNGEHKCGITPRNAVLLAAALARHNVEEGWDLHDAFKNLAEALASSWASTRALKNELFNKLEKYNLPLDLLTDEQRKKLGKFDNVENKYIDDLFNNEEGNSDLVKKWRSYYRDYSHRHLIASTKNLSSPQGFYDQYNFLIKEIIEKYGMPKLSDLILVNQIDKDIKANMPIIKNVINESMIKEDLHIIEEIFIPIRHHLYFCNETDLIIEVSQWVMRLSSICSANTFYMALASLSWVLSSKSGETGLNQAKGLVEQARKDLQNCDILKEVHPEVVWRIAELTVRIPVRFCLKYKVPLTYDEFIGYYKEAQSLMKTSMSLHSKCDMFAFEEKVSISLEYQRALYFYCVSEYEKSKNIFDKIVEDAKNIPWQRIFNAGKSWQARLSHIMGRYEDCERFLQEAMDPRPKRRKQLDQIRKDNNNAQENL